MFKGIEFTFDKIMLSYYKNFVLFITVLNLLFIYVTVEPIDINV